MDETVKTRLAWAALENDNERGMRSLLAAGMKAGGLLGSQTLAEEAARSSPKCLALLLEHGALAGEAGRKGPAFVAAAAGRSDCLKILARHGLDPNQRDGHGQGPLHAAARQGQVEAAIFLLSEGASWAALDHAGHDPAREAVGGKSPKRLEVLRELATAAGGARSFVGAAQLACSFGDEASLKVLIQMGLDVNVRDAEGWTCLHRAVWEGASAPCVGLLIEAGAELEASAGELKTAAWMATLAGRAQLLALLGQAGANVENSDGGESCRLLARERDDGACMAVLDAMELRQVSASGLKKAAPKAL